MKKERKEVLKNQFPALPQEIENSMNGKYHNAENFCVMLEKDNELFVRCYHRYYDGRLLEVHRYVFAPDGCVRYGLNYQTMEWEIRTQFSEPKFHRSFYGYMDNSYRVLNMEAINKTFLKYCMADSYSGTYLMKYLKFCIRHPNAEYPVKQGYSHLVVSEVENRGLFIDWKSNNLLKMLHLNRTEFKLLQGRERDYTAYIAWRESFPNLMAEERIMLLSEFPSAWNTLKKICEKTGLSPMTVFRYLKKSKISYTMDYLDYIHECEKLGYNLNDSMINRPRNFNAAHERTSKLVVHVQNQLTMESFRNQFEERKKLEFSDENFILRQPESFDEIVAEGRLLNHCVGGYAERHSEGKLHILFIRTRDKPDVPFYTLELGTDGEIIQVRGRGNRSPTDAVYEFVKKYRAYIENVFNRKRRKTA